MSRIQKAMYLLVAILMTVAVFAGCNAATKAPTQAPATTDSATVAPTATVEALPTPAPLPEVTLKFYFGGTAMAATKEVWDNVGVVTKEKLNAKFEVNYVDWGEYPDKMQLLAASGDKYDANFDAYWMCYPQMVNRGAYLDLATLAPKYMPAYTKILTDRGIYNNLFINGKLFTIPWTPFMVDKQILKIDMKISGAEAAGIKYDTGSIKTVEELDAFFQDAKTKIPGKHYFDGDYMEETVIGNVLFAKYGINNQFKFHFIGEELADTAFKMLPLEQTAWFAETVKWNTKWVKDGIIPKDMLVNIDGHSSESQDIKLVTNGTWLPTKEFSPDCHYQDLYPDAQWPLPHPLNNTMCLNANAANPERTLMFLDLISVDEKAYDAVNYGIEGVTFKYVGPKQVSVPDGMKPDEPNYLGASGLWGMWRDYFQKADSPETALVYKYDAERRKDPKFIVSPTIGFFPDSEPIKNELTKRDALFEEYGKPLINGFSKDPDKDLAAYIQMQKDAGLDKILAEIQKQADAYAATRK